MIRRLAALSVLAFSFALISYTGLATGQDKKDTPKATSKGTTKGSSKGSKKGKAPEKTEKTEKSE